MATLTDRRPELLSTENWPRPFPHDHILALGEDMIVAYKPTDTGLADKSRRFWLPLLFEALFDRPPLPLCQLRIGVKTSGPACLEFTLAGSVSEPLTSSRIRLPLRELVEEATLFLGGQDRKTMKHEPEAFARELAVTFPQAEPGKRLPRELLEEVARVYRYALQLGTPPTNAVAEALNVSRSTAGRYVVRARRDGLLGPASPGVAGEQESNGEEHDG